MSKVVKQQLTLCFISITIRKTKVVNKVKKHISEANKIKRKEENTNMNNAQSHSSDMCKNRTMTKGNYKILNKPLLLTIYKDKKENIITRNKDFKQYILYNQYVKTIIDHMHERRSQFPYCEVFISM